MGSKQLRGGRQLGRVSVALATALLVVVAAAPGHASHEHSDVPDAHPFHDEIGWMAREGITQGYEDGSFGPDRVVTRRAMAAFLYRFAGSPEGPFAAPRFSDVPQDHRFREAIGWMAQEGVTQGYGDGSFGPDRAVTRKAMAAFLHRLADVLDSRVEITLLATNDVHGQLHPPDADYGGAAYLATHLEQVREREPNALYVDTGDATGGNIGLSRRFGGEPTIEALNAMGLDVQALGNHEFDDGTAELERRYAGGCWLDDCWYRDGRPYPGADWAPLAGNVRERGADAPLFPGTWMTEVEGVDIGFVGVTATDLLVEIGHLELEYTPWQIAIAEQTEELKAAGADIIVVLRHVGSQQDGDPDECSNWTGAAADYNRAFIDPAVDVVIDGHSHQAYVCDEPGVPLTTQAFQRTLMFTEIDLVFDTEEGEIVERAATNRWVTHDVEPDPEVVEVIDRYEGWR